MTTRSRKLRDRSLRVCTYSLVVLTGACASDDQPASHVPAGLLAGADVEDILNRGMPNSDGAQSSSATAPAPSVQTTDGDATLLASDWHVPAFAALRAGQRKIHEVEPGVLRGYHPAHDVESVFRGGAAHVRAAHLRDAASSHDASPLIERARTLSDVEPAELRTLYLERGGEVLQTSATSFARAKCRQGDSAAAPCESAVEMKHPAFTEWWENTESGMEHGYDIEQRPLASAHGPLSVVLGVRDARVTLNAETNTATLHLGDESELQYGQLVVRDASGRELPSWLELTGDGQLAIKVNDEEAIYPIVIDPFLTTAYYTDESDQVAAYLGYSVAHVGDVNGDGYGDAIAGAPFYDNGQTDEGVVAIYYGSATGLGTTFGILERNQAGANFGLSVAAAGDVNGDGYNDIIVGAPYWDYDTGNEGAIFVYHGGASGLSLTPAASRFVDNPGAFFGYRVASAGDVNNDGYGDVVGGAVGYSNGQAKEGAFAVYHGGPSGLGVSAARFVQSNIINGYMGMALASGDFNNDSYSDVVVGVPTNGASGSASTFVGSASGIGATAAGTLSPSGLQNFGSMLANAGDWSGDGLPDLLAYAPSSTTTKDVRIFKSGWSGIFSSSDYISVETENRGVYAIAAIGDVDHVGSSDIAVGVNYSNGQANEGAVLRFRTYGESAPVQVIEGNVADMQLGTAISGGDVNGDAIPDLLVGAYLGTNGQSQEGLVKSYHGRIRSPGTSPSDTTTQLGANIGTLTSVAALGDVNDDGMGDMAYGYRAANTVVAAYGDPLGGPLTTTTITAPQANSFFGNAVDGVGDVNGDGFEDMLVGAPLYTNGQSSEGAVHLYFGSNGGFFTTPSWTYEGDVAGALTGISLAGAGDVNGDGYSDFLVTQSYSDGVGTYSDGRVQLFYGSSTLPTLGWTVTGNDSNLGGSVSGAGDINRDGYADFVIGGATDTRGQASEGAAYVYHGSSTGPSATPNAILERNDANALFGTSVASAGDVDGDGFGDIVVGAPNYGPSDAGEATVFRGSAAGVIATPAYTLSGLLLGSHHGAAVRGIGDANCDGRSEVAVGAPEYNSAPPAQGNVFMYGWNESGVFTLVQSFAPEGSGSVVGRLLSGPIDMQGRGCGALSFMIGNANAGSGTSYFGSWSPLATSVGKMGFFQRRNPTSSTIVSGGRASTTTAYVGVRRPYHYLGRTRVKLQVEVKSLGVPFDGTGFTTSSWMDANPVGAGSAIALPIARPAGDRVHWRARLVFDPSRNPAHPRTPWNYGGKSGDALGVDFVVP